ncbi:hypothetical protein BJF78_17065 [Pseudonocardia sp. CNS-139]|nr:hypothetical protein BJF78_17065 [Pseudonocardia sp. CNS-139]
MLHALGHEPAVLRHPEPHEPALAQHHRRGEQAEQHLPHHGGHQGCGSAPATAAAEAAVRAVAEAGVLGERERVHVAAQQYRGPAAGALQHGHDRADRPPEVHLHRQVGERGDHGVAGVREVEPQLRTPVDGATERDRARLDAARLGVQSGDRGDVQRHARDPRTSRR